MSPRFVRNSIFYILAVFILIMSLWYVYFRSKRVSHLPTDSICIDTFDSFAFTFPEFDGPAQDVIYPLDPWYSVNVPVETTMDLAQSDVIILRPGREGDVLWFTSEEIESSDPIHIYDIANDEWHVNLRPVQEGLPHVALPYFSSHLDTVVGIGLARATNDSQPTMLMRFAFDDADAQFNVEAKIELPLALGSRLATEWAESANIRNLVVDEEDVLWLFLERDAIYRFEFDTQTIERLYPLEKISRIHTVTYAEAQPFYFSDFDTTYEYDPQKNTLTTLDVPYAEERPTAAFVESGGKLWSASSLWYRPPGERVQSFHPRPFLYWWHQVLLDKWRYYIPPSPFTETSDGRIWFETERSSNWKVLRSGMAWFDPSTREGCWFTSETGPLEEDSEGNLWLLIEGALYGNEDAIENVENLE